jgi:hypothetical protein
VDATSEIVSMSEILNTKGIEIEIRIEKGIDRGIQIEMEIVDEIKA